MLGLFSALLGGASQQSAAGGNSASRQSQSNLDLSVLGLGGLTLEAGSDSADNTDPEAIAAAMDLGIALNSKVAPEPVVRLIDALAALKADLAAGKAPDPALLADAEKALKGLTDALGIDMASLPEGVDFAALLDGDAKDNPLASLLAPLANALTQDVIVSVGAQADAAAGQGLTDRVQALGDRLAALLGQIENGAVSADKLASLGLGPSGKLDADIEAALARLSAGIVTDPNQVPQEPDLATPALKLTEAAIAGKSAANVSADGQTPALTADADGKKGDGEPGRSDTKQASSTTSQSGTSAVQPAKPTDDSASARPAEPVQRETTAAAQPTLAENAAETTASPVQQQASAKVDLTMAPRVVQAGYQTSQQQLNLPQIAFELARQVQDGNTRFQIRLDPPELGRIDVRLDIDKAGQVNARLTVEKAETLDLMQRDQRGLERALQQAGIDSGKTNLEFSLKQNPFAGQDWGQDQRGQQGAGKSGDADTAEADAVEEAPPTVNLYRGSLQARGINIIA